MNNTLERGHISAAQYTGQVPPRTATASRARRYQRPEEVRRVRLAEVLPTWRTIPDRQQARLKVEGAEQDGDTWLYCVGDLSLLRRPCVALVGTRQISEDGVKRTRRLARELVQAGVVVVSGLALGVDECAHETAMTAGGSTVAVIGTGVARAYPASHAELQETIYRDHLLVSPFSDEQAVHVSNWPHRNKVMAALSDATVIVEASDTSGTLHQAAECLRLGRHLFIMRAVVDDPKLTWPEKFLKGSPPNVHSLRETSQILAAIQKP